MFGDDEDRGRDEAGPDEDVVSVIGPGMEVEGDCRCTGSLRVDGRVHGTIRSEKSVVVGSGGEVEGDIVTQDALIAGSVVGTVHAESRVELKEGCRVEGDIRSPSVRLEEGGRVDGALRMSGEEASPLESVSGGPEPASAETVGGADGSDPSAHQASG